MQILNSTRMSVVAERAEVADTFVARMAGLLSRHALAGDEALVITDCRSIHMFFMRFAIDVIFADREKEVLRLVRGIRPFCVSPYVFKAYYAIEGPQGMIERSGTKAGDQLKFEENC